MSCIVRCSPLCVFLTTHRSSHLYISASIFLPMRVFRRVATLKLLSTLIWPGLFASSHYWLNNPSNLVKAFNTNHCSKKKLVLNAMRFWLLFVTLSHMWEYLKNLANSWHLNSKEGEIFHWIELNGIWCWIFQQLTLKKEKEWLMHLNKKRKKKGICFWQPKLIELQHYVLSTFNRIAINVG